MNAGEFKIYFENIKDFLLQSSTQKLYTRSVNVRKNSAWAKDVSLIKSFNIPVHPLHGKCFVTAAFCYYFAGAKASGWKLKCIKSQFVYLTLPDGTDLKTTHWFIEDKLGNIFDPSKSQFCHGYQPDGHYKTGVNGAIGWPYFRWKGNKGSRHNENVPSQEVLRLAEEYVAQFGQAGHLDEWLKQSRKFRQTVI